MWLKRQCFMSFGKLPNMKNGFSWHSVNQMLAHLLHQPAGWASTSCSSGPLRNVQPRAFSLIGNRFFSSQKFYEGFFFLLKFVFRILPVGHLSFLVLLAGTDRWTVLSRGGNMKQERRLQPLPHTNYRKFNEICYLFEFSCLNI